MENISPGLILLSKRYTDSTHCKAHNEINLSDWLSDLSYFVQPEKVDEKEYDKNNKKKLSLSEAVELVDNTLSDFLNKHKDKILIKADQGVGKTYLAIKHAIDAAAQDNVTPIISLPNYNLVEEKK